MISIILYVLSILAANFTAANLVQIGPFTIAIGTLFFGATFTLRDYIHRTHGKNTAYKSIGAVFVLSIIQSAAMGVPVRIIIASCVALLIAEVTDTQIYHNLMHRSWFTRVVRSNAISTVLDSLLFSLIAFLGVLPAGILVSKILTDVMLKYGIGLLVALPRVKANNKTLTAS